jgi:DNA-binding response OmpR family regulator
MVGKAGRQETEKRLLLADDDVNIRTLLADFFVGQHFEVETAPDGETALALFTSGRFDVILVDYQMTGMTGLDVAVAVRQQDVHIPIALITGFASTLDAQDVARAGITKIFAKPFDLHEISHWLESLAL